MELNRGEPVHLPVARTQTSLRDGKEVNGYCNKYNTAKANLSAYRLTLEVRPTEADVALG